MSSDKNNLIWIDLEMTGLDPMQDTILEIATIVTDDALNILAEGPVLAIHQSAMILDGMDEWNRTHHTASGLVARVQASAHNVIDAETATLDFLTAWVPAGASPLCGNSICQDRRFLARWMPRLEAYCHYRNLDVSTLKIIAQRWAPAIADGFKKTNQHLALADIRESISELQYYRTQLLKSF